jgi:hypothetical protein
MMGRQSALHAQTYIRLFSGSTCHGGKGSKMSDDRAETNSTGPDDLNIAAQRAKLNTMGPM